MNQIESSNITFSKRIKEELVTNEYSDIFIVPILSSFIKNNGEYYINKSSSRIEIKSDDAKIIKFIYSLIKRLFPNINLSFTYRKINRFNKLTLYILNCLSNTQELLKSLYINPLETKININLINKDEKIKGYFIGLFLSTGSCSNPLSSNYHFEFNLKSLESSENILKLINKLKVYPFSFKSIKRRQNYVVYLKKSDEIASFIAYLGANDSSLIYEGYRLDREMNNYSNRQLNLDMYNYNKTINNSEKILESIKLIDKYIGINNLENIKLKELAKIKLDNPETSYMELSILLSKKLNIKISKGNIYHLINKLKDIAKRYEEN